MTPEPVQQSRQIFAEGVAHFEAGQLAEARACFERCLDLTPERPSVLGNLGITLYRLGQPRDALPLLHQATAGDPGLADAWAALGLAHEVVGDWTQAVAALQRALALDDRSALQWFCLGQCRMRLGHHDDALQALDVNRQEVIS